jgi:site-specific recombinase XerD
MPRRQPQPPVDLAALLPSWQLALRAERKSPRTVETYSDGVNRFLRWCPETGHVPVLDKPTVTTFVADLLDNGAEATTARARHLALRRYAAWLVDESELPEDPLLGVKAPKLDTKVVHRLSDDQLRALIRACRGTGLAERRDEAIVRLMTETTARAGEVVAMEVADVDLTRLIVVVRRGKGGKGRVVPFGAVTGRAVDRYVRLRRSHRLAGTPALWLGERSRKFGYDALHKSLKMRAAAAGIDGFHPHLLRHTGAQRWLDAGGSEGGLMAVAGWARHEMLERYTKATSEARAADEARRLGLGDEL